MKIKSIALTLALTALTSTAFAAPDEVNAFMIGDAAPDLKAIGKSVETSCFTGFLMHLKNRGYYSFEHNGGIRGGIETQFVEGFDEATGKPYYVVATKLSENTQIVTAIGSLMPVSFACVAFVKPYEKNIAKNAKIAAKNEKLVAKGRKPKPLKSEWYGEQAKLLEVKAYGETIH